MRLAERMPWVAALGGTSVTEMEILHGVLNDPAAAGHAFIYTRDPAWVSNRASGRTGDPERARERRRDRGARSGGGRRSRPGASSTPRRPEAQGTRGRPADCGNTPIQGRSESACSPTSRRWSRRSIPPTWVADALTRDAEAHRAFAAGANAWLRPAPAVADELDAFAVGGGPPLVLTGEPGAGASAIACAWLAQWRTAHPHDAIVEHHVGATADASEWSAMAVRLVARSSRDNTVSRASLPTPPADPAGRRAALFAAIVRAGSLDRRTVILVDGADLLDRCRWRARSDLAAQGSPAFGSSRGHDQRRASGRSRATPWMDGDHGPASRRGRAPRLHPRVPRVAMPRASTRIHVARLVGAASTGNALFLRTVLDELRQHGDHFTIGEVIDRYLGGEHARRAARAGARTLRARLRA